MSGGHAPYLMPDGRSLTDVLRQSQRKNSSNTRAKDDLWLQLQKNKVTACSDQELQEIRAIERVGARRRQRWLNDKALRDLAGPLSAADMQAQFAPVPFGSWPPPSPFAVAMAPDMAPLMDRFRHIDMDKQDTVLARWEEHNREERQQQQQQHGSSGSGSLDQHQTAAAAAAAALERWRLVSRAARTAMKKANVHSVLELEMQVLQVLDQGGELLLELPDSFARLLVHGLAEFHGLLSSTRVQNGAKLVVVRQRQPQQPQCSDQQQQQSPGGGSSDAGPRSVEEPAAAGSSGGGTAEDAAAAADGGRQHGSSAGAAWLLHKAEVTCSDVLMALHELGAGFDSRGLHGYMKTHVHGSNCDTPRQGAAMVAHA